MSIDGWTKNDDGTYTQTIGVHADVVRQMVGSDGVTVQGPDGVWYTPEKWLEKWGERFHQKIVLTGCTI